MNRFSDKTIATAAVVFAVLIGGAQAPFIKIALKQTSPEVFTFLRFFISTLVLLPFFLAAKIKFNRDLPKLILVTLFSTANILLFAYGLKLTTASIGQSIYIFVPIMVTFLSYFLLKEKINSKKLSGILIGFIGAIIIILLPLFEKNTPFSGNLLGNLLVFIGALFFSFFTVLSKKLHVKFSPMQVTMTFSLTTAFAMLILIFSQVSDLGSEIKNFSSETFFAIFYVGVLGTAISYIFYQYAIKHGSPTIASTILYLQPATTILVAAILLGERITLGFVIGAILAVIGTSLIIKFK